MIIIGVDPGVSGAWAVLKAGSVRTDSIPVWQPTGKNKTVDIPSFAAELYQLAEAPWAIWIELGQSMPNQSSSAGFNYGRACGAIESVFYCAFPRSPVHYVRPGVWKRKLGLLKQEKSVSLDVARRLFPQNRDQFKRKKDHNRAEAALIAYYGAEILAKGQ